VDYPSLEKEGLAFLKSSALVLNLILFMAGVNLVASAFDAALPAFIIPNAKGGSAMFGIVTSCAGIAMVAGSLTLSMLPTPKNRVKVIFWTMIFSLGTENFLLSVAKKPLIWCFAQILGWFVVPIMDGNLSVVLRSSIPVELQGRVYACRNTLQYFTIPIGLFLGGYLIDNFCEPFMAKQELGSIFCKLFGTEKGSGAALLIFGLGILGILVCLICGRKLKNVSYEENKSL